MTTLMAHLKQQGRIDLAIGVDVSLGIDTVPVDLRRKSARLLAENADQVMFVGSGRPLEDAVRVAFKAMVGWVRDASGLGDLDAYQFVSQNTKASIVQIVDTEYTALVKIDKKRLPTRGA